MESRSHHLPLVQLVLPFLTRPANAADCVAHESNIVSMYLPIASTLLLAFGSWCPRSLEAVAYAVASKYGPILNPEQG